MDEEITTTTTRVRKSRKKSITRWIREYLLDLDQSHMEELAAYRYEIRIQRKQRERWVYVARLFDDLIKLPEELAEAYGGGLFRLFITVYDDEHEKKIFLKIADYAIEGEPIERSEEVEDNTEDKIEAMRLQWEREKLEKQHQHEERMKMLEMFANVKGPGVSTSQLMQMFKLGLNVASGLPPEEPGKENEEQPEMLNALVKGIGEGVVRVLTEKLSIPGLAKSSNTEAQDLPQDQEQKVPALGSPLN